MKTRLAVFWAAIVAAGVTAVGVLTGRRRRRRAERQKARDERRRDRAQRKGQGARKRATAAARSASAASTTSAGAARPSGSPAPETSSEPAPPGATPGPAAADAQEGDDLQAIKGLGSVAEAKLKDAGIKTYEQIASWTPEEVQETAARLNLQAGRITSDDWVGQARKLAEERAAGS